MALGKAGGQIIRTAQPVRSPKGTATKLAIRPEEVKIEELAPGDVLPTGVNRLHATVESVTFLGAIVRVKAGLEDGQPLSIDLFNDRQLVLPREGETVKLVFPPDACWVSETVAA